MLFNSLQFCVFFVVVTVLYYGLPSQWRWKMLLVASCVFYMAFVPAYIFILFGTIIIDYFMGLKIAATEGPRRKLYLQISIVATCLVLFIFKYCNFFSLSVRQLQHFLGDSPSFPLAHIILPIGLSFHTFQSLSYVIEVYRGKQKPEKNFGIYSLYVMFYPQLVAGPIERPQNLLHQFYEEHPFDIENLVIGLRHIAWGFFQKMVIADRCAIYVNRAYDDWSMRSGLTLMIATALFSIQIYSDFAGYSNIAIGCARIMGFRLMRNFNHPYFSIRIAEFWTRWHISLSTWFRDYVYIPLGGNRVSRLRHCGILLVTFGISGLWHGANWTFVIWGLYNGALLIIENVFEKAVGEVHLNWLLTQVKRVVVLFAICIGWVFFRAQSLTAALGILHRMFLSFSVSVESLKWAVELFTNDSSAMAVGIVTVLLILGMLVLEKLGEDGYETMWLSGLRPQTFVIIAAFETVMLFGVLQPSAFIYFQF